LGSEAICSPTHVLGVIDDPAELELETIDGRGKLLGIDLRIVQVFNLANRELVQDHGRIVHLFDRPVKC
jgi:hypothetical protein